MSRQCEASDPSFRIPCKIRCIRANRPRMKASTVWCWKYWMSKIHPPLPMNPHESRTLLMAFTSSFQRHLDREYPEAMSLHRSHVRQHIQSVLDNPLIGGSRKPCNHFDGHVKSLSQLRHLMKRPMDHFKHEVDAGTATIESAKMCLTAQLQLARASADKPVPLPSSGAGSIVLNWMCSLPSRRAELLLLDRRLVKLLAAVLNTESNEKMIWHWIKLLQQEVRNEPSKPKRQLIHFTQSIITGSFLENEIKNASLSSAVDVFVRGVAEMASWQNNHILMRPGRFLMLHILNESSLIATSQLDSFIQTVWVWSKTPQVHQMLLALYRPQCTNLGAALSFLADLDVDGVASLKMRGRRHQREDLVRLSLKVAELLQSFGSEQETRWVMDFLRANFAVEIGLSDPDVSPPIRHKESRGKQSPPSVEESSLRLLDSLAVH